MSTRRLLPFVLILVAGIGTQAKSQTLTAPSQTFDPTTGTRNLPAPAHLPSLFDSQKTEPATPRFRIPATPLPKPVNMQLAALLAPHDSTCYAIRTYGFTPGDLQSDAPRPSSYSTCTSTGPSLRKKASSPEGR